MNIRIACFALIAAFASFSAGVADAGMMVYNISFENDGTLTSSSFGTIKVSESDPNKLTFEIDVLNEVMGIGKDADIQSFGFQVNNFVGSLSVTPTTIDGASLAVSANGKVQGMGNTVFDYVVSFGNGSPRLDPLTFTLMGTESFTLANLVASDTVTTNTGIVTNFGLHVQSTFPATPGSEALGGRWNGAPVSNNPAVPEPTSAVAFLLLGLAAMKFRGTRKPCVS